MCEYMGNVVLDKERTTRFQDFTDKEDVITVKFDDVRTIL